MSTQIKPSITRLVKASVYCLMIAANLLWGIAQPVNISGQINDYAAVQAIAYQSITLDDASAFSAGDKVLIIQMKGAIISESDDPTYGTILDYGYAGNYEINVVSNVVNQELQLNYPIGSTYNPADIVQAVRIPVYADAEVVAPLIAKNWDGTTGGILILQATGILTLGADLDVRTAGFRGGDLNGRATPGGTTYICAFNSGQGGIKGEGITEVAQAACRGKLANGGGGGNDHNGGGGGGGNYGSGGDGGHGWLSNKTGQLSDLDKGGRGGSALDTLYEIGIPKLFLGGGGGGGHQNNGASVPAANGAGIVILLADTLDLTVPVTIHANALNATDVHVNDGAGGGGAGGSVFFDVQHIINPQNLFIDVSGGNGATIYTRDQHGPGGGGAGGYLNSTAPLPPLVQVDTSAGQPGLFISTNTSNPYNNTPHGATAGQDGSILSNAVLQFSSLPPTLDLDLSTAGTDFAGTFIMGAQPVSIAAPNLVDITDDDDVYIYSATILLTNAQDGADESLTITLPGDSLDEYGITSITSNSGHSIYLIGFSSLAHYETVIGSIVYENTAAVPDLLTRQILSIVNDGGSNSNLTETRLDLIDAILPVDLQEFNAQREGANVRLNWLVESSHPIDRFEIEHATDTSRFQTFATLHTHQQQPEQTAYEIIDEDANASPLYYRLRIIDKNAHVGYSNVIRLAGTSLYVPMHLSAFHDLEQQEALIRLEHGAVLRGDLRVYNPTGRQLYHRIIEALVPETSWHLPIANWPAGAYIIRLNYGNGVLTRKFMVF